MTTTPKPQVPVWDPSIPREERMRQYAAYIDATKPSPVPDSPHPVTDNDAQSTTSSQTLNNSPDQNPSDSVGLEDAGYELGSLESELSAALTKELAKPEPTQAEANVSTQQVAPQAILEPNASNEDQHPKEPIKRKMGKEEWALLLLNFIRTLPAGSPNGPYKIAIFEDMGSFVTPEGIKVINGMYVYGSSQQIGTDAIVAEGMCWVKTTRFPPTEQNRVWTYNAAVILNDDNGENISAPVFSTQNQSAANVIEPSWDDVVAALKAIVLNKHGNVNIDNRIRFLECQTLGMPYDGPPLSIPEGQRRPRLPGLPPNKVFAVPANQAPRIHGPSSGPGPAARPAVQDAATTQSPQRHQAQGSAKQVSISNNTAPSHPSQGSTANTARGNGPHSLSQGPGVNTGRANIPPNLSQGPAVNTAHSLNRPSGAIQGMSNGTKAIAPPQILKNASTNQLLHQIQGSTAQAFNSGYNAPAHLYQGLMRNNAGENASHLPQSPTVGTDHNIDLLKFGPPKAYNSIYASPQPATLSKIIVGAPQATQVAVGMGIETNHQRALQHQSHLLYQQRVAHFAATQHGQMPVLNSPMTRVFRDNTSTIQDSTFPRYQVPHLRGVTTMVPPHYPANPLNIGQHTGGTKRKIDDTNIHAPNNHVQTAPAPSAKRVALSPQQVAEANARQFGSAPPHTNFGFGNPQMIQGNVRYVNGVPTPGALQPSPIGRAHQAQMNGSAPQTSPSSRIYAHPPQMNGSAPQPTPTGRAHPGLMNGSVPQASPPNRVYPHPPQMNGSPLRSGPVHPAHSPIRGGPSQAQMTGSPIGRVPAHLQMDGSAPQPSPPRRAHPQMNGDPFAGVSAHSQMAGSPIRGGPAHQAQTNGLARPSPNQMNNMGQTYNAAMGMAPNPWARFIPPEIANIPALPHIPSPPPIDLNAMLAGLERDAMDPTADDAAAIRNALEGLRRHTERMKSTQGGS